MIMWTLVFNYRTKFFDAGIDPRHWFVLFILTWNASQLIFYVFCNYSFYLNKTRGQYSLEIPEFLLSFEKFTQSIFQKTQSFPQQFSFHQIWSNIFLFNNLFVILQWRGDYLVNKWKYMSIIVDVLCKAQSEQWDQFLGRIKSIGILLYFSSRWLPIPTPNHEKHRNWAHDSLC